MQTTTNRVGKTRYAAKLGRCGTTASSSGQIKEGSGSSARTLDRNGQIDHLRAARRRHERAIFGCWVYSVWTAMSHENPARSGPYISGPAPRSDRSTNLAYIEWKMVGSPDWRVRTEILVWSSFGLSPIPVAAPSFVPLGGPHLPMFAVHYIDKLTRSLEMDSRWAIDTTEVNSTVPPRTGDLAVFIGRRGRLWWPPSPVVRVSRAR
jgi:hypothetical protein